MPSTVCTVLVASYVRFSDTCQYRVLYICIYVCFQNLHTSKHDALKQCQLKAAATVSETGQHLFNIGAMYHDIFGSFCLVMCSFGSLSQ